MTSELNTPLMRSFLPGVAEALPVELDFRAGKYLLRISNREWYSGLEGVYAPEAVRDIGRQLEAQDISIQGCGNCVYFHHSGLSQQFSNGAVAYCGLAGFRRPDATVRIDHGCGEFSLVEGWPNDPAAIHEHRMRVVAAAPRPSRINAFQGAMVGLAAGDALGYPVEFLHRDKIISTYGRDGVTDFATAPDGHPPGTYSDDTQMSIAVAEGLLETASENIESRMSAIGRHLVAWSKSHENDRAPGTTCMDGLRRFASGVPWREAGIRESKGCGSTIRVAPIGLMFWRNTPLLLELARSSALLTHGHDAAIEGAAAAALLVALALKKRTPNEMFRGVMVECAPRSPALKACFEKLPELLSQDPGIVLSRDGLGEGWVSEEAVACALYCFWRHPLDYRRAVLMAVNSDGDSDSIACITGGMAGAFNGLSSLPAPWVNRVENSQHLKQLGSRLFDAASH
jgi:ADP-ribosylglycohydrolase